MMANLLRWLSGYSRYRLILLSGMFTLGMLLVTVLMGISGWNYTIHAVCGMLTVLSGLFHGGLVFFHRRKVR